MPGEEFPIKNRETALRCYRKYWRCGDYSCPLYFNCSTGLIDYTTDNEVKAVFEVV